MVVGNAITFEKVLLLCPFWLLSCHVLNIATDFPGSMTKVYNTTSEVYEWYFPLGGDKYQMFNE